MEVMFVLLLYMNDNLKEWMVTMRMILVSGLRWECLDV